MAGRAEEAEGGRVEEQGDVVGKVEAGEDGEREGFEDP